MKHPKYVFGSVDTPVVDFVTHLSQLAVAPALEANIIPPTNKITGGIHIVIEHAVRIFL
jgi:hypothetical protein